MQPNFCPNCGRRFANEGNSRVPFGIVESEAIVGWDCFCDACYWSGDIEPDYSSEIEMREWLAQREQDANPT